MKSILDLAKERLAEIRPIVDEGNMLLSMIQAGQGSLPMLEDPCIFTLESVGAGEHVMLPMDLPIACELRAFAIDGEIANNFEVSSFKAGLWDAILSGRPVSAREFANRTNFIKDPLEEPLTIGAGFPVNMRIRNVSSSPSPFKVTLYCARRRQHRTR